MSWLVPSLVLSIQSIYFRVQLIVRKSLIRFSIISSTDNEIAAVYSPGIVVVALLNEISGRLLLIGHHPNNISSHVARGPQWKDKDTLIRASGKLAFK